MDQSAASPAAIELVPLDAIHPAPWNVRTGHDVAGIAESIRVNGFRDPLEVWRKTGEIVAGEGRYHAARELGLDRVPVLYHEFDSLASAKRYAIANNRLTDKSEWDLPALEEQLGELEGLAGSGFSELEMEALFGGDLSNWAPTIDPGMAGGDGEADARSTVTVRCPEDLVDEVRKAVQALCAQWEGVDVE